MEPRIYRARANTRIVFTDPDGETQTLYPGLKWGIPAEKAKAELIRSQLALALTDGSYSPELLESLKPSRRKGKGKVRGHHAVCRSYMEHKKTGWKPKTLQYNSDLESVVLQVPFDCKPADFAEAALKLGRTEQVVLRVLKYLRSAYDLSVLTGKSLRNPFTREVKIFTMSLGKAMPKNADILLPEDKARVLDFLYTREECVYFEFIRFFFSEGWRPGEIAALELDDFNGRKVSITKNVSFIDKKPVVVEGTKTGRSRTVELHDETIKPSTFGKTKLVFPYREGYLDPNGQLGQVWRRALSNLGIKHRKLYSVRSYYINEQLDKGVPPSMIARRLDTSISVIEKNYFAR